MPRLICPHRAIPKLVVSAITVASLAMFVLSYGSVLAADSDYEKRVPLEELLKTRAANLWATEDYELALDEFLGLSRIYPDDMLPKRYTAMTLTLLGRLDEAASILEDLAQKEPENPAHHYFLARVYHEQGAQEKAEERLNQVMELDPDGYYGEPARQALPIVKGRGSVERPWDVYLTAGYEYDSNIPLESTDKALNGPGDESAGRYFLQTGGTYRYFRDDRLAATAGATFYKSLHDDSLDEFNYTFFDFFHFFQKRLTAFGREVVLGFRQSLPFGFLKGNIFIWGVELTPFINSRLTRNTFTEVYHRYSPVDYGPDGGIPSQLSRDGQYNTTGLHHRYYFSDFRRYVYTTYELQVADTRGDSFDRIGHNIQVGFHTPILSDRLSADVVGSFLTANYPHYSDVIAPAEPLARLDNNWTVLARLTYDLTRSISVQGFYRYQNANNENDIFQYDRHISGAQITFRY